MNKARLQEIGCILIAAGTNDSFVTFNRADVELLGLLGNKEKVTVTKVAPRLQGYLPPQGTPLPEDKQVERQAVEPILLNDENGDEADVRSYNVNVGIAVKACEKLLGGPIRRMPGLRQKDVPSPTPNDELVNA